MRRREIIIIGAGLAGVSAAWTLARHGHSVTVLDALDGPGLETSFANAGALTPSEPEPWNQPGIAWQLLASLFDPHAAMKLRLAPLPGLIGWGLRFLRNSTHARYGAASRANFALARYSLAATQAVRDELGLEFDNLKSGTLKLCRNQAGIDAAVLAAERLVPLGLNYRLLDRAATLALEPRLTAIADAIAGSIHYPDDESGDAHRFTAALAAAAEAAGVSFEWGTRVTELLDRGGQIVGVCTETEEIEADTVIIAAGHTAWSLLKPLGLHLPVRPVKGYSLTLDMSDLKTRPAIPVCDEALHAIVTPMGERLRVAGTAEIAGNDKRLRPERVENLKSLVRAIYPQFADRLLAGEINAWAGFRPMSADGRPFIGETRAKGLWLTTGHGHLGWTQAMGSAGLLAALIDGETPPVDPAPFAASRI
ncbi:D-amino acid dehydrogenase [Maricaulis sp.]|uniref:D-amino acid dehydrogenase n=1 Tax=Maricaulis sp. TaxID=1486257 RepID=UPI003A8E134F